MKTNILLFSVMVLVLNSCIKKELDMQIVEPSCKGIKIKGIYYEFISDPTCDTSKNSGTLAIKGEIDGDPACVDFMVIEAKFFDANGTELIPISGGSQKLNSKDIVIVNKTFAINVDYTFAKSDYPKINYVQLNYHTENELGSSSNKLNLRANPPCMPIPPPLTYDKTITINNTVNYITVNFSDHAAQDGDLISVNVNGAWVLENILLTNQGENYNVPVVKGTNWFYLYALNQGTSGLNTVTVKVHTNLQTTEFVFDLKTAESKAFKIVIQ